MNQKIRDTHFPVGMFASIMGLLLLVAGIHIGLIQIFREVQLNTIVFIIVIIVYWALVSVFITKYIHKKMKRSYEDPLQMLAQATDQVAHGDFSVYVPTIHTADKMDYLDVMILDFNNMVEELGSIETLKTDFFSNVSHEIKTPLTVIANTAEVIKSEGSLSTKQLEYVDTILGASKKLSNLITNILKLNRLEKQTIQPEIESYNICQQLCECILQFERVWEEKNIELEVDVEDCVMIEADSSLMELVWNNLVSNALKFTEPGGTVCIREYSTEQEVQIQVSDRGCGMSEETMRHIFDKFYQGDTSHTTEGNGLGLALVVRILQLSGGSIEVASELGKGTTFTVTLGKQVK